MKLIDDFKRSLKKLVDLIEDSETETIISSLSSGGLTHNQYYGRKENPDLWKEGELIALFDHFGLDDKPIKDFFLYKKSVKSMISKSGLKQTLVQDKTGLTKWQLQRRYKRPELFTMEEIKKIDKVLHVFD